jgi:hypothetical protein
MSVKEKSPVHQSPVVDAILPSAGDLAGSSKAVSAIHHRVLSCVDDGESSSS